MSEAARDWTPDQKLAAISVKRDKVFLRKLHEGGASSLKVLKNSSDKELNTLITVLHFLVNGEIPMAKSLFEVLREKNHLRRLNQRVQRKSDTAKFKKSDRSDKLSFLSKLCPFYHQILNPLFKKKIL